jgi:hypothetical protein
MRRSNLVRTDGSGATHELLDYCPERRLRCSVAYEQTDQLRAAILHVREDSSIASLASDGSERPNGRSARSPTCWTSRHGRHDHG